MFWIKRLWYKRLRNIDINVLWKSICNNTSDLTNAKAAFALHCFHDPAWYEVYTEEEIFSFIDNLSFPR